MTIIKLYTLMYSSNFSMNSTTIIPALFFRSSESFIQNQLPQLFLFIFPSRLKSGSLYTCETNILPLIKLFKFSINNTDFKKIIALNLNTLLLTAFWLIIFLYNHIPFYRKSVVYTLSFSNPKNISESFLSCT